MYAKQLKQLINALPDETEIIIEDTVGDTFGTLGTYYNPAKNTLTFIADDIIF